MNRFLFAALLSLSAATATASEPAPSLAVCQSIALPFTTPPDDVTAEWCDTEWSEWLFDRAAIYCARHEGSAWCACYASGAYDI